MSSEEQATVDDQQTQIEAPVTSGETESQAPVALTEPAKEEGASAPASRGPPDVAKYFSVKINNIPFECKEDDLKTVFGVYGQIMDVSVSLRFRCRNGKLRARYTQHSNSPCA